MGEGSYGAMGVEFYLDDTEAKKAVRHFGNTIEKTQDSFDKFLDSLVPVAREVGKITKTVLDLPRKTAKMLDPVKGSRNLGNRATGLAGGLMFGDTAMLQKELAELSTVALAGVENVGRLQREVLDLRAALNITTGEAAEAIAVLSDYGRALTTNGVLLNTYSKKVLKDAIKMQKAWGLSLEEGIKLHADLRVDMGRSFKYNKRYIEGMRGLAEATGLAVDKIAALRSELRELSIIINDKNLRTLFIEGGMVAGAQLERYGIDASNWISKLSDMMSPITAADVAPMLSMMGISPGDPKIAEDMLGTLRNGAKMLNLYTAEQKIALGFSRQELVEMERLAKLKDEDFKLLQKRVRLDRDWNKIRSTLIESSIRIGNALRDVFREGLMPIVTVLGSVLSLVAKLLEGFASLISVLSKYTFGLGPLFLLLLAKKAIFLGVLNAQLFLVTKAFKGLSIVVGLFSKQAGLAMLTLSKKYAVFIAGIQKIYGNFMITFTKTMNMAITGVTKVMKDNPLIMAIMGAIVVMTALERKFKTFSKLLGIHKEETYKVAEEMNRWEQFTDKMSRTLGFLIPIIIAAGLAFKMGFGPWGAVIAGITAGIVWFIEKWDEMTGSVQSGIKAIGDGFIRLVKGLYKVFTALNKLVMWWLEPLQHLATGLWKLIKLDFKGAMASFGAAIGSGVDNYIDGIKGLVDSLSEVFGAGVDISKGGYQAIAGAIKDGIIKADKDKEDIDIHSLLQNITGMYSGRQIAYVDQSGKSHSLTSPVDVHTPKSDITPNNVQDFLISTMRELIEKAEGIRTGAYENTDRIVEAVDKPKTFGISGSWGSKSDKDKEYDTIFSAGEIPSGSRNIGVLF